jgi:hypothetical protein
LRFSWNVLRVRRPGITVVSVPFSLWAIPGWYVGGAASRAAHAQQGLRYRFSTPSVNDADLLLVIGIGDELLRFKGSSAV